MLGPAHLRRASTAAWASLQAHGQAAAKTSAREVVALVRHVVGDAPPCAAPPDGHALAPGRLLGAAGLAWLVQLRWRAPAGRASAPPGAAGDCAGCDIVLTDGLGVFLVVVVEHLGLIKTPRGRKRVEAFARQVGARAHTGRPLRYATCVLPSEAAGVTRACGMRCARLAARPQSVCAQQHVCAGWCACVLTLAESVLEACTCARPAAACRTGKRLQ